MTVFFLAAAAMLVAALALILVPLLRPLPETAAGGKRPPATITGVVAAILVPFAAVGLYFAITSYPWRGEAHPAAGPSTELPSIEEVMPWLHLVFDAWEDYRAQKAHEADERMRREIASPEFSGLDEADDGKRKKKKKRRK